jgi:hypothetical protein
MLASDGILTPLGKYRNFTSQPNQTPTVSFHSKRLAPRGEAAEREHSRVRDL